jgi:hypothetical protein
VEGFYQYFILCQAKGSFNINTRPFVHDGVIHGKNDLLPGLLYNLLDAR